MPTKRDILELLKRNELLDALDAFDLEVADRRRRDNLVDTLGRSRKATLQAILEDLPRARLKDICRGLDLDDSGRAKAVIVERLMGRPLKSPTPTAEPSGQIELDIAAPNSDIPDPGLPDLEAPDPDSVRDDRGRIEPAEDEPISLTDRPPSIRGLLGVLRRARLVALGRELGVAVPASATRDRQAQALADSGQLTLSTLLRAMSRDELKAACRAYGLDPGGRSRPVLAQRLLDAYDSTTDAAVQPLFDGDGDERLVPQTGDIVQARHRQYLVEDILLPSPPGRGVGGEGPPKAAPGTEDDDDNGDATLIRLVCLDDDNQGQRLELLWELELGARILQPQAHGLGAITGLDEPRHFAAYLNALKWNAVTATEARLFQAPFRAGIQLMNHQLPPLKRALELPRANLFIADDVGLGKTIEAGLILQELQLRQRIDFVLIVCPAAISLQWRDEMARRFGLHFELYNRAFMGRRRQERGFQVNPWDTHNRFIISYQTLRRPEYREPLLRHLGERTKKSLLILDEAHTAAPATASKYAVDSRVTKVIRDVAPRFENRLFLSATPHNGHSNSFSALLELLDPQRFTRGIDVTPAERDRVMVRRLKSDIRQLGADYPVRQVVRVDLRHHQGTWTAELDDGDVRDLGERPLIDGEPPELRLSTLLQEYSELMRPERGTGQLVFINLQKRLLSSIAAFATTLAKHAERIGTGKAQTALQLTNPTDDDEYGMDDDAVEAAHAASTEASSSVLQTPEGRARDLLDEMTRLAAQYRLAPDAKVLALIDWIKRHQCGAVALGGASGSSSSSPLPLGEGPGVRAWSPTRVILFTEWGETKKYLSELLTAAVEDTDRGDERILYFHGGMSDEQREEVQNAFNAAPDEHPVRILIATDAAREGINLQAHCADLFHFDVPWNPARMEQRNGRIDRTLQKAKEVRCYYFVYPQRVEDLVLQKLVFKVDTIRDELGSLGTILLERLSEVMDRGIDDTTGNALDRAAEPGSRQQTTRHELEAVRADLDALTRETDEATRILSRSRQVLGFEPKLLRDAVDVGLELAGAERIQPLEQDNGGPPVFELPELPESWQATLDSLRPTRGRQEPFWEWRRRPPLPVVFEPLSRISSAQVHLHLQHPFVRRILSRFLAQGYSAQDLHRVTAVLDPTDDIVRAIAVGRLSLFGPGATRLHDEIVPVMAPWFESGGADHLEPLGDVRDRQLFKELNALLDRSPTLGDIPKAAQKRLQDQAGDVFTTLWPHIRDEAESRAHEAEQELRERGATEAVALKKILEAQRRKIDDKIHEKQLDLPFDKNDDAQREQFEQDKKFMQHRRAAIEREIEDEPRQIEELYQVAVRRLEPVGLIYLWPTTRGMG